MEASPATDPQQARGVQLTHMDVHDFSQSYPQKKLIRLEKHRQKLEEIYRQEGAGGAEREEVKNLMELTFTLQRHHVNTLPPPDNENVKSKWLFLFTPRYIYTHILSCSQTSMCFEAWNSVWRNVEQPSQNTSGENLLTYVKDILSNGEDNEMALCVVQLLMAHFGENLTKFYFFFILLHEYYYICENSSINDFVAQRKHACKLINYLHVVTQLLNCFMAKVQGFKKYFTCPTVTLLNVLKVPYHKKHVFSALCIYKLVLPEPANSPNEENK